MTTGEPGGIGSGGARTVWRRFVSPRFTVGLLVALAALCLLLVVLPQERVVGAEAFATLVESSRWRRYLLVDLGLGDLPTSRVFLAVLALFFLNLGAVLAARVRPTLRRIELRPLSEKGLVAWARLEESRVGRIGSGFDAAHVATVLRDFGYRARRAGERTFWGVRHRTAPLGFLIFHLSFFVLFLGGVAIYLTRFQGTLNLSEGQRFDGRFATYDRIPPLGGAPRLDVTLVEVDPRVEGGETTHLSARLRFAAGGTPVELPVRVNAPARWGAARILIERAGLAPVVVLWDGDGFAIDRVTVPVRSAGPSELELAGGRYRLRVHPPRDRAFPAPEEAASTPLRYELAIPDRDEPALDAELRAGEVSAFEGGRIEVAEVRFWAAFRVVEERGGGLLIAGFAIGILGIAWRLLLYRREVAVTWDGEELRLVGRCEYFSRRFQGELDELLYALTGSTAETAGAAGEGETR